MSLTGRRGYESNGFMISAIPKTPALPLKALVAGWSSDGNSPAWLLCIPQNPSSNAPSSRKPSLLFPWAALRPSLARP